MRTAGKRAFMVAISRAHYRDRVAAIADDGWDTRALLVNGYVERHPRRSEAVRQLRVETVLMPWLAPRLPLTVPVPRVVSEDPFVVRHRLVPGERARCPGAAQGRRLGAFLRALHAVDAVDAAGRGVPSGAEVAARRAQLLEESRTMVLPLLPSDGRAAAIGVLEELPGAPAGRLVHADIAPSHVLELNGALTGVIDFGDAHIGDAADFAWVLHEAPRAFCDGVAEEYDVSPGLRGRALMWHRTAPWLEAGFGLQTDVPHLVRSGLGGILRQTEA